MAGAGGVYVGGGATVVMDPPPLVYLKCFHPGSGPDRMNKRQAESVAILARDLVPVWSGLLRSTIRAEQNRNELGWYTFGHNVVAQTPYVMYVHEGTGPSPRWPDSRKVMKWSGSYPPVPYRDFVMHPGTPAVPFLRDALVAMAVT
jgi:hypothetical protein